MRTVQKLAIFGPLAPPHTGMEEATGTLLHLLARAADERLTYRHVDTRVNRVQAERERFSLRKLRPFARQFRTSVQLSAAGYDAYYPPSQNRIGLVRDVCLLLPFRMARRRIILHLHGSAFRDVLAREPWWLRVAVLAVMSSARTRGIVLTPSLVDKLEPIVPSSRTLTVPNTVLAPSEAPRHLRDASELSVLFLGTLMRSKGYRELILAVKRLRGTGLPVRLRVAGEPFTGQDAAWLKHEASPGVVDVLGPLVPEAKWQAIDESHVVVVPSTGPEGQPLVLLEAMARGRGIVATARGGIRETLGDDTAILLPALAGRALEDALMEALLALCQNRDELERLSAAAQGRFECMFSPDRFLEAWLFAVGKASS